MRRHLALTLGFLLLALTAQASDPAVQLHDGDIIFHHSLSELSEAISLVTGSDITHMGMIVMRDGQPWVLEAAGTIRYTPLDEFVKNGADGHFVVKRLKNAGELLSKDALAKIHAAGEKYLGRPYDGFFGWSDDQLYCSELVWKVYNAAGIQLGGLHKLGEYDYSSPIVQAQLKQRYGDKVPVNEPVVAPSDIFKLGSLETVLSR